MSAKPVAVILAGGANTRFWPLREKSLYRFEGVSLLEKQLAVYRQAGFEEAIIIANPGNRDEIAQTLTAANFDPNTYDIVVQDEPLGMGHAIMQATSVLEHKGFPPVYICQVNDVVDAVLHQKMMEIYRTGKGVSYLAGYRVKSYFPGGYLEIDEVNRIHGLIEKPGAGNEPSDLVNIVAHVHTDIKTLLEKIEVLYASDHPSDDHYEVAMAQIMADNPFYCVPYDGAWYPIKFPWHVLDVTRHYLDQIEGQTIHPEAFVHENTAILGNVVIEAGAKVFIGASIVGPAHIGKGAIIGNGALVRESMIDEGAIVGHTSEVARSYLGRQVSLHRAVVLDSVFEDEVNFSAGCITANLRIDHGNVNSVVKGERMNTGRDKLGAMVGEGAFIGIQSGTMPGIKIGPGAEVGAFTNVTHDVAQGERFYSVQEARTVKAKGRVE